MTTTRTSWAARCAAATLVATAALDATASAGRAVEDVPWTGQTCEAAFVSRHAVSVLLEDDVYGHPAVLVPEALATSDVDWQTKARKRDHRLARSVTTRTGEHELRPGRVLSVMIPCALTRSWVTPAGMLARSRLYVSANGGSAATPVWSRDLYPTSSLGVVKVATTPRGDALYEIG